MSPFRLLLREERAALTIVLPPEAVRELAGFWRALMGLALAPGVLFSALALLRYRSAAELAPLFAAWCAVAVPVLFLGSLRIADARDRGETGVTLDRETGIVRRGAEGLASLDDTLRLRAAPGEPGTVRSIWLETPAGRRVPLAPFSLLGGLYAAEEAGRIGEWLRRG